MLTYLILHIEARKCHSIISLLITCKWYMYQTSATVTNTSACRYITQANVNNKRPMGYIAHLRKQFKSINTYI